MTRNVRMFNTTHRYDGESGPTDTPSVQWSYELDTDTREIAVWDGQVYVTGEDGSISVFNTDGDPQWRFQTDGSVKSSPAVVDGTVYIGSEDEHVYALDAVSGTERWSFQRADLAPPTVWAVVSSPAVVDNTVYVGSSDKHVYALDAASGTERWSFQTGGEVRSSPAVVDGTVYVGSNEGTVSAIDASGGTERWSFQTDEPVASSPVVKDGTVYVAGRDTVYALGSNDTETKLFERCSACQTDLTDYSDPAFCPECGADLSDSGGDTQIYDP